MKPLFSLVIPVYNAEKYLDRLFQSINKQSYKNYEVLIIDDGSTDNTKEICLDMTNKSSRFSYIRQKNGGVSVARNRGLERAKGKYLFFIDADDELMEGALQQLADTVSEDEKIDILFFGKNNLNKYGKIISTTRMQNCPREVI
ncbi:glycosyltransferase family A protein, partial [Pediococcus acidilactici]|uniref:glycosyltransferase family 2 protein n=1 Tax=Pediococcus acidilactici TaxID=1254 RepID=UPI00237B3AEC